MFRLDTFIFNQKEAFNAPSPLNKHTRIATHLARALTQKTWRNA